MRQKFSSFAVPLPDSIMVVRQILDLYVEVRALVGQQRINRMPCKSSIYEAFFIWGLAKIDAPEDCPARPPQSKNIFSNSALVRIFNFLNFLSKLTFSERISESPEVIKPEEVWRARAIK
jgi:hypothetical protein